MSVREADGSGSVRVQKLMRKVLDELGLITYVNAAKLTWAALDREVHRGGRNVCLVSCYAVLCCVMPCGAVLCCVMPCCAVRCCAELCGAVGLFGAPAGRRPSSQVEWTGKCACDAGSENTIVSGPLRTRNF